MSNKDIHLSKSLSWLLRHGAIREGFLPRGKFSSDDIERVVKNNDKQRFKLRLNPHTHTQEIKANQGHTITEVTNADLIPILQPKYKTVVHGTYLKCWPQIKSEGLSRMQRQHIHLAKGTPDDHTVTSGVRRNTQIYIYINLEKALTEGIQFYESENGVILTTGNSKGYLEPKYFLKAIQACNGEVLPT